MKGEIIPYYSEEALEVLKDENAHLIIDGREFAPVKHGHWEDREVIDEIESSTAIDQWQVAKCSVCRRYHTTPYMYSFTDYEYCPWCGAYMMEDYKNE